MASPTPVFPDVGSMIVPPGRSAPEASAASTIRSAIRSLTDPPGLMYSTLASTAGASPRPCPRPCPLLRCLVTLRSLTIGVFPIRSISDSCTCMAEPPCSPAVPSLGHAQVTGRKWTTGDEDQKSATVRSHVVTLCALGITMASEPREDLVTLLLADHDRRLSRAPIDQFAAVLDATPDGWDATVAKLLFEVRNFEPSPRNSTGTLASLVRISLLAQIDAGWWGRAPSYQEDSDVRDAADLVDPDRLDEAGQLAFRYRQQAVTLVARAARSAERRALPGRSPKTAGLWLPRAKPQAVTWLNELAWEFAGITPDGTPPLWVTSVARSVEHQRHLKSLGYIALLPSAHCVGYAADIEMKWYRRFHAHRILRGLLLDRQRADQVNVIDEGQAWHVCLRPEAADGLPPIPAPRPGS